MQRSVRGIPCCCGNVPIVTDETAVRSVNVVQQWAPRRHATIYIHSTVEYSTIQYRPTYMGPRYRWIRENDGLLGKDGINFSIFPDTL
jgi:hypothetical protein